MTTFVKRVRKGLAMAGPLEGIKVVELGVWVAGPGRGRHPGGLGSRRRQDRAADRRPGPDVRPHARPRRTARARRSRWTTAASAASRSTSRPTTVGATALELLSGADVFLTNVRPGALRRIGLDFETAAAANPRLVYGLITGYGDAGPDADRAAYDVAAFWARAGLAHLLTRPGDTPPFQRGGMGDHTAAMTLAAAVCAALSPGRARARASWCPPRSTGRAPTPSAST